MIDDCDFYNDYFTKGSKLKRNKTIPNIKEETFDKIVYLMNISEAKFRKPVFPGDEVYAYVTALRSRGRVWKFNGISKDKNNNIIAESTWSATIMDKE